MTYQKLAKFIDLPTKSNDMGSLVAIENQKDLPFNFKRIYYLHNLPPSAERGKHAHYKLEQLAICISGSCKVLLDNGVVAEEVALTKNNRGLLLQPLIWHELYDFSPDCVVLVLASDNYDEADYIRDYATFVQQVKPISHALRS